MSAALTKTTGASAKAAGRKRLYMSEGNVPEPRAFDNVSEAPADVVEAVASEARSTSTAPAFPAADRSTLGRFIASVFKGIETGHGHIVLRFIEHFGKERGLGGWHPFGQGLLSAVTRAATETAARRGDEVAVFCPSPCVFGDVTFQGRRRAYEDNVIACGVIAIELDEQPRETLAKARHILGEPTLVLRSGGVWDGPGGPEDKLHVYWRLTAPATRKEDLRRLKMVRYGLLRLCGGDGTAVPLSHPMRWPGSWHTKGTPRLSTIESETEHEIVLAGAEALIEIAADIAGIDLTKAPVGRRSCDGGFKTQVALGKVVLDALAEAIPNPPDLPWGDWNERGLAFYDASHGSPEGLEAFHLYGQKNDRYDPDSTDLRWSHYERYPPSELAAGTLVYLAKEAVRGFKLPFDIDAHFDAEAAAVAEQTSSAHVPDYVHRLNQSHAFVMNSGQAAVINIGEDGTYSFSNPRSFKDCYANDTIFIDKRSQSVAELWWRHPHRNQFVHGVDFAPEGVGPGVFNLWRGFHPRGGAAAPGGSCTLILAHIREILCSGNAEAYRYLIGWLAHMVQRPEEKPGVAVVLKGTKGTGKDTLPMYLDAMMPGLRFGTSQQDHVTGRFNGHLANVLFLHLEEATWAGSKQNESALKSLITSPTLAAEYKGVTTLTVKSKLRVLMTSNEEWVVPASAEERRYFVCHVGSARRGDLPYFKAIYQERDSGGAIALLSYLRSVNLSGFEVRKFPNTEGLQQQKLASIRSFDLWLYEQLADGGLWADEASATIEREHFYNAYRGWAEKRRYEGPAWTKERIGRHLRGLLPPGWDLDVRLPRDDEGKRAYAYCLPPLSVCRACWAAVFEIPNAFEASGLGAPRPGAKP